MALPGIRIKQHFTRPPRELVDALQAIPAANIGDILQRIWCMNARIKPWNTSPLAGPAFTVKVRAGDNLMLHKALDMAEPGDVLVVEAQGCLDYAVTGELMLLWARRRGIRGLVLDGCVRDIDTLSSFTDFAVYAVGVTPNGPSREGGGEINYPVACGGVVVSPGDIIIGDTDGVVIVPPHAAHEVLRLAEGKNAKETKDKEAIQNLRWDRTWVDKALAAKGCLFED